MTSGIHPLIIIGSGPAGLTAAIYAGRANLKPLLFEGPRPGGQLMGTTTVDNWPGDYGIMGQDLIKKMREHARLCSVEYQPSPIARVDFSQSPLTIWTEKEEPYSAHAIIIATGAAPLQLGCPGEDEYWGKGVTTCAICDGAFYHNKSIIVVGGGDTAMEEASFLKRFTEKITIIQITESLTATHAMQQRVINDPTTSIIYNSTIAEIKGNKDRVTEVLIKNSKTGSVSSHPIDGVFLAIGVKPASSFLKGQVQCDDHGYITLHEQTQTSVKGVFAAGDVHDWHYRQAITAAGFGCMAALDAIRYLKNVL